MRLDEQTVFRSIGSEQTRQMRNIACAWNQADSVPDDQRIADISSVVHRLLIMREHTAG
jgi:hypothetical protein